MGNCVAREIGFGVETRARNDALVKKIQEVIIFDYFREDIIAILFSS